MNVRLDPEFKLDFVTQKKDNSAKCGEKVRCMTCRLRRARGDQQMGSEKMEKISTRYNSQMMLSNYIYH